LAREEEAKKLASFQELSPAQSYPAYESPSGQSSLAYRLAAGMLLVTAGMSVLGRILSAVVPDMVETFNVCTGIRVLIGIGLGVGLLTVKRDARRWVLVFAGLSALAVAVFSFLLYDGVTGALMTIMQWAYSGALWLLLTGQSKTGRLVAAALLYTLLYLGPNILLVLLATLAGVAG
jgi:hypothetical protein